MSVTKIEMNVPEGISRGLELMTCMAKLAPQAPEGEILWSRSIKLDAHHRATVEVRNEVGANVRIHLMEGSPGQWNLIETIGPCDSLWESHRFSKRPIELTITTPDAPAYPVLNIRA